MPKPATKRDLTRILLALGVCPACEAEPAEVLTLRDAGRENEGAACAPPSDCDAANPDQPSQTGCACVPGATVGCLETLDVGDASCPVIAGTKRCQADGTWTACLGPVTVDALQGITCTLVRSSCGPLGVFSSTSGDCAKALRCP